eukprot:GHVT01089856.1.p1 GENE.GHVT01089856.1~~GHVT01089856.1.p1  ORF type:complete len:114 (+),score=6.61 GHVT01089856.1:173-514(+)
MHTAVRDSKSHLQPSWRDGMLPSIMPAAGQQRSNQPHFFYGFLYTFFLGLNCCINYVRQQVTSKSFQERGGSYYNSFYAGVCGIASALLRPPLRRLLALDATRSTDAPTIQLA